jgi:hypothetical protein
MPKKDISDTVRGMLSSAGASTLLAERPTVDDLPPAPVAEAAPAPEPEPEPEPEVVIPEPPRALHPPAAPAPSPTARVLPPAPRTLRLRASTADSLRAAWFEAKRDDVLLTAQDFASDLVEEALATRARRRNRSVS